MDLLAYAYDSALVVDPCICVPPRGAYANDLGAQRSLVAVTAKTNRSKAEQDSATWLPPPADARCTYAADWVSTKLRWGLTELASGCGQQPVEYKTAAEAGR